MVPGAQPFAGSAPNNQLVNVNITLQSKSQSNEAARIEPEPSETNFIKRQASQMSQNHSPEK